MTIKVPDGWDMIEARRSTPHGEFVVTLYPEGDAHANLWPQDGADAVPIGGPCDFERAVRRCNLELGVLNVKQPATCGAEDVDANGAPV